MTLATWFFKYQSTSCKPPNHQPQKSSIIATVFVFSIVSTLSKRARILKHRLEYGRPIWHFRVTQRDDSISKQVAIELAAVAVWIIAWIRHQGDWLEWVSDGEDDDVDHWSSHAKTSNTCCFNWRFHLCFVYSCGFTTAPRNCGFSTAFSWNKRSCCSCKVFCSRIDCLEEGGAPPKWSEMVPTQIGIPLEFYFAPWVHQPYDPFCHEGIQNEPKKVLAQGGFFWIH